MANQTPHSPIRIAVLQGNPTVARRMRQVLEATSQFEVEQLRGLPPGARRAQAVLIDVDSDGVDAHRWINHCEGRQLPVILSGLSGDEERVGQRPFLTRPFSPKTLRDICSEAVGLSAIRVDEGVDTPTLDLGGEGEEEEGLFDVLDLDGSASMILEIEDLAEREHVGGMLAREVERTVIDAASLTEDNPWSSMADTAVESADEQVSEVTAVSRIEAIAGGDLSSTHQVAGVLAEYWQRLGLTARPSDRADRLQRVLAALMQQGLQGVLEVLERVPRSTGFGGDLSVLSAVDLMNLIRDRQLRGRLEVALQSQSYVMYVEGTTLHKIDSLGENTDRLLIDSLEELGAIGPEEKARYQSLLNSSRGDMLEMALRREGAISDGALLEAKRHKARRLLARICDAGDGNFAFIELSKESGEPWPNRSLALNLEALLLEVMRHREDLAVSEPDGGARFAPGRKRVSTDVGRALTSREAEVLKFFEEEESLADAERSLTEGSEPIEEVAGRLERLELLRRLGGGDSDAEAAEASSKARLERETAVGSNWEIDPWGGNPAESTRRRDRLQEDTREDEGYKLGVPEDEDQ